VSVVPEEGDEEENAPGEDPVCVLDAVVCVHFAGANLNRVLTAALGYAGCFASIEQLTAAYRKLQAYGSGLPDLRHTMLRDSFLLWEEQIGGA
jgi:hypothetical protein